MTTPWYTLYDEAEIDSPALIIYKDRVRENIERLADSIDDPDRLRPHVKTHKSPQVIAMFLQKGITKFKCATIAEAEMLAQAGALDVLLAYQLVGPKAERFLDLIVAYPRVRFSCLIDNARTANHLSSLCGQERLRLDYFIDVNVGMNRTGIPPDEIRSLFTEIRNLPDLRLRGLHVYDGHIRDKDFALRTRRCDEAFASVMPVCKALQEQTSEALTIIAGGTPTFSVHAKRSDIECSPGTFVYWDKGYEEMLPEQHYLHAAVVLTRVISKPAPDTVCIDLGHKAIASENPLANRVFFLNAAGISPIAHSEEHMVLKTNGLQLEIGDVLYGVPYHVCPTIALYEKTHVAVGNRIAEVWLTLSRNRKITI